jgi:Putative beta-lactamase-inhibitor-like, PepSY-like
MKNLVFFALLFSGLNCLATGQKIPPAEVSNAFKQKFESAKSVKWSNESSNEWEAEFVMNGKEMSSSFDNGGKWLETETEISSKDLPAKVSSALAKEFPGYKTGEMSLLESPEMKGYEIALKKEKSSIEVVIDLSGKVVKNTPVGAKSEK